MKAASSKHTPPVRLLRREGRWSLEYTRLVSVDPHILRPERRRVAATPDALRSLHETHPQERIAEAIALMTQVDDGTERAFELADHGWTDAPAQALSERRFTEGDLATQLADTKAQLVVMRGLYDTLLSRVVALESAASRAQQSVPPRLGRRVPSRKSLLDSLKNGLEPATFERAAPGAAPAREFERALPKAAAEARPVNATQASPGAPRLSTPSSSEIVDCLQMLAADVPVTPERLPLPSDLSSFYVSRLSDESGEAIAALLFNQRAAAELGGGILSVAVADRDQQADEGLTSDSLDGLREVANNLTGLLNRSNPKLPVRLGTLDQGTETLPDWLNNPAKKLGFSVRDGGALFLLVRGVTAA